MHLKFKNIENLSYNSQEVVLSFSGGLDTTLSAILLSEKYKKVHLLTYKNGFNCFHRWSKARVVNLKNKIGSDKFEQKIVDISDIGKKLRTDLYPLIKKYKTPMVIDMACKLSMAIGNIVYCLKNNIYFVADGSDMEQSYMFDQKPEWLEELNKFYREYGIIFLTPVYYHGSRKEKRKRIEKVNIKMGKMKFMDNFKIFSALGISSQLGKQPICTLSPMGLFLWKTGLFFAKVEDAIEFIQRKREISKDCVRNGLNRGNLHLEKVVATRLKNIERYNPKGIMPDETKK